MSDRRGPSVLLVGHGSFGPLYARALRDAGALAGVVVRQEASARRLAGSMAEPVGTSYEAMLDATRPDGVAVLSPTPWHAAHAAIALRRGLPVMVIKPVTALPETAEALAEVAASTGGRVLVGHEGVFASPFRALEDAVRSGAVGELREIQWLEEGRGQLSGGRADEDDEDAADNLGHTYATAMHDLYAANRLAGRVAPVRAEVMHVVASKRRPALDARLEYPGGVVLRLRRDGSPALPFRRGLRVVGSRGSALWLMQPGKTSLTLRRGREERDMPHAGGRSASPADAVIQGLFDVIGGADPRETLRDGASALRAARMLASAAAKHLGQTASLDAIAEGPDRPSDA